jgi:hypothetical protein
MLTTGYTARSTRYALSITEDLTIPVCEGVNDGHNIRIFIQTLLFLCRYQTPELVDVDDWSPRLVAGQVEVSHTNFTEVTRMVLIEVGSVVQAVDQILGSTERRNQRTCGGEHHQQDHDHRGASCAFLHVHDRPIRGRGACESS